MKLVCDSPHYTLSRGVAKTEGGAITTAVASASCAHVSIYNNTAPNFPRSLVVRMPSVRRTFGRLAAAAGQSHRAGLLEASGTNARGHGTRRGRVG